MKQDKKGDIVIVKEDLVSIIVPIYNIEQYLERCIESIINQVYKELEIVLVNDGSTDNSGAICDRYAVKDSRIRVIHKKNGGLVSARKAGLEIATGQYIGFVDGDDYINEDMYQELVKNIKATDADFVHSGYINKSGNCLYPENAIFDLEHGDVIESFLRDYILDHTSELRIIPCIWSKLFKAELIKSSYKFVPDTQSIGEDWISLLECIFQSKKISLLNFAAYHYTIRQGSLCHLNDINDFLWQAGYYKALEATLKKYGYYEKEKKWLDAMLLSTIWTSMERRFPVDFAMSRFSFRNIGLLLGKRIVLYGAGEVGRDYYSQISRYTNCRIVRWVDADFRNIYYDCTEIVGKDYLKSDDFDYLIIAIKNKKIAEKVKDILIKEDLVEASKILWEKPEDICGVKI